ncbi:hypothetical protein IFM89_030028 [Coptis chinensis]|uniref:Uncharacterized protein n=1 Tax=Coptis chinensis TaxID=261450 RepID=A0A835IQR8_9MAGN|nr:hypothetical protein IFM89_030028 [Coptis chinensis]
MHYVKSIEVIPTPRAGEKASRRARTGRTIPGKIKTSDYKGGKQESVKYDGDEICWLDLEKDVQKLVSEGVEFQIVSLIEGNLCRITEDKHLMDMRGKFKTKKKNLFFFPPPPTVAASITANNSPAPLKSTPRTPNKKPIQVCESVRISPRLCNSNSVPVPVPIEVSTQEQPNPVQSQNPKPFATQKQKPDSTREQPNPIQSQKSKPFATQKQKPASSKKPITPLRKSNRLNVLKTKPLLGSNGEPMIFYIFYVEETTKPEARDELIENVVEEHIGVQRRDELIENVVEEHIGVQARDELIENVVEEHIEPDVHLSQLDPIEPDFCTQNINDFLDELNEYNIAHGDAVRVDVDEGNLIMVVILKRLGMSMVKHLDQFLVLGWM